MRRTLLRLLVSLPALFLPLRAEPGPGTVSKGLALEVKTTKPVFAAKEPVTFTLTLRNTSDKAYLLYDADWIYRRISVDIDKRWLAQSVSTVGFVRSQPTAKDSIALEPGQAKSYTFDLSTLSLRERGPGNPAGTVVPENRLPPGKHSLTHTAIFRASPAKADFAHPHWTGTLRVTSNEFEIQAAP